MEELEPLNDDQYFDHIRTKLSNMEIKKAKNIANADFNNRIICLRLLVRIFEICETRLKKAA